jgi:hypothetical protein
VGVADGPFAVDPTDANDVWFVNQHQPDNPLTPNRDVLYHSKDGLKTAESVPAVARPLYLGISRAAKGAPATVVAMAGNPNTQPFVSVDGGAAFTPLEDAVSRTGIYGMVLTPITGRLYIVADEQGDCAGHFGSGGDPSTWCHVALARSGWTRDGLSSPPWKATRLWDRVTFADGSAVILPVGTNRVFVQAANGPPKCESGCSKVEPFYLSVVRVAR